MAKQFLDTNIIVYANDAADAEKQKSAIELVARLMRSGDGVISTQVQMEYAAVASGKLEQPRSAAERQLVLLERFEVVQVNGRLIREGLELSESFQVSFSDGVIIAAAIASRCGILWSEDLSSGRKYGGVTVRSPF